jgi:hypothetical protein
MSRREEYRAALRLMPDSEWEAYLSANSNLPGPRANLELAQAVADVATAVVLRRYAGSDDEYLAACGAIGLGRLLVEGDHRAEADLHRLARSDRWRVREGVAIALQRLGDEERDQMLALALKWAKDPSPLVRRAAVAGVCEPRLLDSPAVVSSVVTILDEVTRGLAATPKEQRRHDDIRVLRQAWATAGASTLPPCPPKGSPGWRYGLESMTPTSAGCWARTSARPGYGRRIQSGGRGWRRCWRVRELFTAARWWRSGVRGERSKMITTGKGTMPPSGPDGSRCHGGRLGRDARGRWVPPSEKGMGWSRSQAEAGYPTAGKDTAGVS